MLNPIKLHSINMWLIKSTIFTNRFSLLKFLISEPIS